VRSENASRFHTQPDDRKKSPRAVRTDSKKFELVGYGLEAVLRGDPFFNSFRKAFFDLHDCGTFFADQMMMMAVVVFADEFEPRRAIAKIKPLHHAHFFQQVHRAVNGRQITPASGHLGKNLPVRERMRMVPQNFQYGRARASDLERPAPQPAGKHGHFLSAVRMRVRVCFHGAPKVAPAIFEIK
jgi:hypothetical protein